MSVDNRYNESCKTAITQAPRKGGDARHLSRSPRTLVDKHQYTYAFWRGTGAFFHIDQIQPKGRKERIGLLLAQAFGRVTADLEPKEGQYGPYFHFSLAVDRGFGERKHTAFLECWAFGETASRLKNAQIKKGSSLWICGDADVTEFTRQNGSLDHSLKITVSEWGFLPVPKPKPDMSTPQEIPMPEEPPEIDGDCEELP